jgi:hypothetical protein
MADKIHRHPGIIGINGLILGHDPECMQNGRKSSDLRAASCILPAGWWGGAGLPASGPAAGAFILC